MPSDLEAELRTIERRLLPRHLEGLVVRLCAWKPQSLKSLSRLLRRDDIYLQNTVIKRLLADGRLAFLHPGQPNHPRQGYVPGKGRSPRAPRKPRVPAASRSVSPRAESSPPRFGMEMPDIGRND